jgi:hypothetical protein
MAIPLQGALDVFESLVELDKNRDHGAFFQRTFFKYPFEKSSMVFHVGFDLGLILDVGRVFF